MPPARRAAPGLPLAVLHAAQGPAHRRVPGRQSARHREPRALRHRRRGALPLHPGHHRQGDGRRPRRADRPLCRVAAPVDDPDVHRDGQDAADPLPRAAVRLRLLRHQLPGRSPRLLDHHEPLDDRATGDREEAARPDGEAPQMSIMDRMLLGRSSQTASAAPTDAPAVANGKSGTAKASESKSGNGKTATAAPKPKSRPAAPPPPSPRKKKKRSGRRR